MNERITKLRGKHEFTIFISRELEERLKALAKKHNTTKSNVARMLIKMGIPVMEGLAEAKEEMLNVVSKISEMGIEEKGYEKDQLKTEL